MFKVGDLIWADASKSCVVRILKLRNENENVKVVRYIMPKEAVVPFYGRVGTKCDLRLYFCVAPNAFDIARFKKLGLL